MLRCASRLIATLLLSLPQAILADPLVLESPRARVSLLELYTSEGCSSCPPADRWLSGLKNDPRLWRQVVPVAFHVDYWDYIGWPDRFASPLYGNRQRLYAWQGRVRTVYTPGFFLNGREWRWRFLSRDLTLPEAPPVGKLTLTVDQGYADAVFSPTADGSIAPLELNVAVLGFGLSTQVRAGENRGRALEHDFVVLGYERGSLRPRGDQLRGRARLPATRFSAPRTALVAWVSGVGDQRPVQALGAWLDTSD